MKSLLHENQEKSDKIFELEQKLLELKDEYNEKIDKLHHR
jgi:hypothetical protein